MGNNTANHNWRVHPLCIRTGPMRLHRRSSELTVYIYIYIYIYIWSMSHHSRTSTQPSLIITELSKLSSQWFGSRPPSRSPMGGKISVRSGHSACEGSNGASCCAALTRHPGAGRPGRRSADLNVGEPAGRTFGLIAAGAGSLRRRRLSCLVNLRPRSCSRQGADRVGQPAPVGSLEMRPHVGARAAAAQVRCEAPRLAHSPGCQVEPARPDPLAPGHPNPLRVT